MTWSLTESWMNSVTAFTFCVASAFFIAAHLRISLLCVSEKEFFHDLDTNLQCMISGKPLNIKDNNIRRRLCQFFVYFYFISVLYLYDVIF